MIVPLSWKLIFGIKQAIQIRDQQKTIERIIAF